MSQVYYYDNERPPVSTHIVYGSLWCTATDDLWCTDHILAFGSRWGDKRYALSADIPFAPVPISDLWTFGEPNWEEDLLGAARLKYPMIVQMSGENGVYAKEELPAGVLHYPTATDASSVIYFATEDGRSGRVSIAMGDVEPYIQGECEGHWFFDVVYAD